MRLRVARDMRRVKDTDGGACGRVRARPAEESTVNDHVAFGLALTGILMALALIVLSFSYGLSATGC